MKTTEQLETYVIGIDVGTGSARAGLFDVGGNLIVSAAQPIQIFRPAPDFVEQSSRDIWESVCKSVKDCLGKSGVDKENVIGISFDATCSLVALDENDAPISVDFDGDARKILSSGWIIAPLNKPMKSIARNIAFWITSAVKSRPSKSRRSSNGLRKTCRKAGGGREDFSI